MATSKPKTYAQQVQDLRGEIEQKDSELLELREKLSTVVPALEKQVKDLEAQLSTNVGTEAAGTRNLKSRLSDAEQRAAGEAGRARALHAQVEELKSVIAQLESQLDAAGKNELKLQQRDKKIDMLVGELSAVNLTVANLNQQLRDKDATYQKHVDQLQRELRAVRTINRQLSEDIETVQNRKDDEIRRLKSHVAVLQQANADLNVKVTQLNIYTARVKHILSNTPNVIDQLKSLGTVVNDKSTE